MLVDGEARISEAKSEVELQEAKTLFLGKQGLLTEILKEMPRLDASVRPEIGRAANQLKERFTSL
ncbi:MAG: phenylalanine--tRNA ligase subunit alpha, partial [Oscillospiraceae bacterium]|nr:phenylalanine--tRNA ligase subunit alpha [Oscillospiraceae bacterium]